MKIKEHFDIVSYNTMRLHCIVDCLYEPESVAELMSLVTNLRGSGKKYQIIGGGSNIILPNELHESVICTKSMDDQIIVNDNIVIAGASVRIQNLIRTCQKSSLGGLEYLYSVPCNVGGAIYMNAGGGRKHNNSISDFVKTIEYYDPDRNQITTITRENADFSYRHSIFQDRNWIITKVTFEFSSSSFEQIEEKIAHRIQYAKEKQAGNLPSSGSIFNKCNIRIMHLIKGISIGGACWSKKTTNWISNKGNASYKDIMRLIKIAKVLHIITFSKYNLEVRIFDNK